MRSTSVFLIASLFAFPAFAGSGNHDSPSMGKDRPEARWLHEAQRVLTASATAPDQGIPKHLLEKAECVGVFPGVTKGAFVVGGEYGHGVFTCREANGTMSAPAFFTIAGGSVGWQFGGSRTDLVLLVMNQEGMKHLLADQFTLGAEATAAAGPVGRTSEAATDAGMHAEILSWSRSRGLIAGASLAGTVIKPDDKAAKEFYGKSMTASEILTQPSVSMPKAAQTFVKTTDTYTRQS
jgi:SH3 domain-containing YSC84-like protein 1